MVDKSMEVMNPTCEEMLKMEKVKQWLEVRDLLMTELNLSISYDDRCVLGQLNRKLTELSPALLAILCQKIEPRIVEAIEINNDVLSRFAFLIRGHLEGQIPLPLVENLRTLTSKSAIAKALIKERSRSGLQILNNLTRLDYKAFEDIASKLIECGLNVDILDLNSVYRRYGRCTIFEMMLEKGVKKHYCTGMADHNFAALPLMLGDFQTIEDLFCETHFRFLDFDSLLYHSALPIFRKLYFKHAYGFMLPEATKAFSKTPSLLELSRNRIQKYLVDNRDVRTYNVYKGIISKLPLPNICKDMLLFKRKLYC